MIWVPNQLVGAPAGTDVTIECHTEAFPRAISYWVYDTAMLLSTKKYITSFTENSYRTHMKLTIRNLREKDFGNYKCIAKNSLGETEGSIRLYEIPMPSVPPKATEIRSGASKDERVVARNSTRPSEITPLGGEQTSGSKRGASFSSSEVSAVTPKPRPAPPSVADSHGDQGSSSMSVWCGQPQIVLASATAVLIRGIWPIRLPAN
ncbi:Hypothetical predicted protein [Cloeon dipterum]|uniref:Ig-like domain-containing protein n=1 Tax=Cloeon dipterum TaxID=197152 RepID=A0A8S1C2E8_9INSE|nr:Hypothetical predicted protein [Cloeon dipterum]